jgi:hypothetical protein
MFDTQMDKDKEHWGVDAGKGAHALCAALSTHSLTRPLYTLYTCTLYTCTLYTFTLYALTLTVTHLCEYVSSLAAGALKYQMDQRGVEHWRHPFLDFDADSLRTGLPHAVAAMDKAIRNGHVVYCHCTAGREGCVSL